MVARRIGGGALGNRPVTPVRLEHDPKKTCRRFHPKGGNRRSEKNHAPTQYVTTIRFNVIGSMV
jgi:hypothetical protein